MLPFIFIGSVYVFYGGIIKLHQMLLVFSWVCLGIALIYAILFIIFRNTTTASLLSLLISVSYLFFKNIQTSIAQIPGLAFLSHYRYFLPLFTVCGIVGFFSIVSSKKSKKNTKLFTYLNVLFSIYLSMVIWGISKVIVNNADNEKQMERSAQIFENTYQKNSLKQDSLPDIWYLVFDSYPSSRYIREVLKSDNDILDEFLSERHFYIVDSSRSNYNQTAFSIPATLNLKYFDWVRDSASSLLPNNFYRAVTSARKAAIVQYLRKLDYDFYNLSMLDFENYPSIKKEKFVLTTNESIILFNTMGEFYKRDIRWKINGFFRKSDHKELQVDQGKVEYLNGYKIFNTTIFDSLPSIIKQYDTPQPKFTYMHVYLPHFPYFYDGQGNARPGSDSLYNDMFISDKEKFTEYVQFARLKAMKVINNILTHKRSRPLVLIFQSDHGPTQVDVSNNNYGFWNYSAIYFSDQNYLTLYRSMSNVNTFRILLNKYFRQQLPLLKDTSIYLK
jgi:hypothetical protein